jgi:hypothetical protein
MFTFVLILISGYEFRMVQHLHEMIFLLNSSVAMDLITVACFLVNIVTLLLLLLLLLLLVSSPLSHSMYMLRGFVLRGIIFD